MTNALKKIQPAVSMTQETADRIRYAIISGDLPLGSKLSEQRLADMLGISRSPVREALAMLQSEGLVNVFSKRGSFVFTPDLKDVEDLCEHRAILESAALRKAISCTRERLVKNLGKAVANMNVAIANNDAVAFTKGDIAFHNAIINSSGNRSIADTYQRTISPLMALRTHLFIEMNDKLDRSMEEHVAILDACRKGRADKAVAMAEEHIFHLSAAYRAAEAKDQIQKVA